MDKHRPSEILHRVVQFVPRKRLRQIGISSPLLPPQILKTIFDGVKGCIYNLHRIFYPFPCYSKRWDFRIIESVWPKPDTDLFTYAIQNIDPCQEIVAWEVSLDRRQLLWANERMPAGHALLPLAARQGNKSYVNTLIGHKKYTPNNQALLPAFGQALRSGHIEISKTLLGQKTLNLNYRWFSYWMIQFCSWEGISLALEHPSISWSKIDPGKDACPLNEVFTYSTDLEKLRRVLAAWKNVRFNLFNAAFYRGYYPEHQWQKVALILDDGRCDPSYSYNHLLIQALFDGQEEIVKMLLKDPRVVKNNTVFFHKNYDSWNKREIQNKLKRFHPNLKVVFTR